MSATAAATAGAVPGTFQILPIDQIDESPLNMRRHFDPKSLGELAASIQSHGVLTPILVRPAGNRYEIAAGARRLRAAKKAKLTEIPAVVRPMEDVHFLEIITIENLQREDVHPLDEALGYKALIEKAGYDPQQIADRIGKSLSYVYQRMQLGKLIPPVQKLFSSDKITASHAVLVARLQPADQEKVLKSVLFEQKYVEQERDEDGRAVPITATVSVRELDAWVRQNILLDLHAAPWKKDDATLYPQAGPCTTCPKRAGNQPSLFPDVKKGDTCTDPACFAVKMARFIDGKRQALAAESKRPILLLSTNWYTKRKDVVDTSDWTKVEGNPCAHATKGVVAEGKQIGHVFTVCADSRCKVHHGSYGGGFQRSAAEKAAEKRRKQGEQLTLRARMAVLDAVLAKISDPLPSQLLQFVAERFLDDIWYEFQKKIASRHQLEPEKPKNKPQRDSADWGKVFHQYITRASDADLYKLLVETALIRDVSQSPDYWDRRSKLNLNEIAKLLRVNAGAIERQVRKDAATAAKPKRKHTPAATRKVQTSTRKARARK